MRIRRISRPSAQMLARYLRVCMLCEKIAADAYRPEQARFTENTGVVFVCNRGYILPP